MNSLCGCVDDPLTFPAGCELNIHDAAKKMKKPLSIGEISPVITMQKKRMEIRRTKLFSDKENKIT